MFRKKLHRFPNSLLDIDTEAENHGQTKVYSLALSKYIVWFDQSI
ncbi:hypothetical protein HMPREF1553_00376 [Porphyromonas gingivalis F0568]|nr:hypothetical protein HMPREF1553_00376 [Porphyromonas gingivalis F0568]